MPVGVTGDALASTPFRIVDLVDAQIQPEATACWESLTAKGGEGMVVEPLDFVTNGLRGRTQPAVKAFGGEHLLIIRGLEYTLPGNLERLRTRSLEARPSLGLGEFALGIESLERFVRREPLRRVH